VAANPVDEGLALVTPRLVLRPFRPDDLDDLHAMDGDERVMRYIGPGLPGRIVGVTHPENLPSQSVLRKIGMRADGTAVYFGRQMRVFSIARGAAP
jgi:RimJ/RimL family protein N-acetyltransferase